MSIAAVVIGRNEGARLVACLEALQGQVTQIIYVDSGSTDGSIVAAQVAGAEVITLDMTQPFTAARARNAGIAAVDPGQDYVQFLDGDCVLRAGWLATAQRFLEGTPKAAVACGRRRERHPEASVYNALIDAEWDTPIGPALACGGDALMRRAAVQEVGGYRDTLIAGEEPELCVRLRAAGWEVWRLDAEMTWHDAAITRFGQWWQRSKRAGHAFAEGAALHGTPPERHWVAQTRRALIWGGVLPVLILLAALLTTPWALALGLIYPLQVLRLARHSGLRWALFTTLGRFPEALGALKFYANRLMRRRQGIIEYK
ncbi:MAG: glycosyltransferase family 2 protein [Sulfitobacter sp.]